jgi:hypothetical protein
MRWTRSSNPPNPPPPRWGMGLAPDWLAGWAVHVSLAAARCLASLISARIWLRLLQSLNCSTMEMLWIIQSSQYCYYHVSLAPPHLSSSPTVSVVCHIFPHQRMKQVVLNTIRVQVPWDYLVWNVPILRRFHIKHNYLSIYIVNNKFWIFLQCFGIYVHKYLTRSWTGLGRLLFPDNLIQKIGIDNITIP